MDDKKKEMDFNEPIEDDREEMDFDANKKPMKANKVLTGDSFAKHFPDEKERRMAKLGHLTDPAILKDKEKTIKHYMSTLDYDEPTVRNFVDKHAKEFGFEQEPISAPTEDELNVAFEKAEADKKAKIRKQLDKKYPTGGDPKIEKQIMDMIDKEENDKRKVDLKDFSNPTVAAIKYQYGEDVTQDKVDKLTDEEIQKAKDYYNKTKPGWTQDEIKFHNEEQPFKFVIKYKDSSEEDYEDVNGAENATKFFEDLKKKGGIDYIEVYDASGDGWEKRDPDSITMSWEDEAKPEVKEERDFDYERPEDESDYPIRRYDGSIEYLGAKYPDEESFIDSTSEDMRNYIRDAKASAYQFPKLSPELIKRAKQYGLQLKGTVSRNDDYNTSGDVVLEGPREMLEEFAENEMSYELNPDYFYEDADSYDPSVLKPRFSNNTLKMLQQLGVDPNNTEKDEGYIQSVYNYVKDRGFDERSIIKAKDWLNKAEELQPGETVTYYTGMGSDHFKVKVLRKMPQKELNEMYNTLNPYAEDGYYEVEYNVLGKPTKSVVWARRLRKE